MLAVEVVEEAGFVTLEAGNADEAVAVLESHLDTLLFTDIDMPGSRDGLKLAHAVHDRWPLTKNTHRIGEGAGAIHRASVEQLLCRKTLPDGCTGRGIAFAGRFPLVG
jgi:CheY-like chemotaxis protein